MVAILTEPAYSGSLWCKALHKSLTDQLKNRRISFCEVFSEIPEDADCLFIIAADFNWIRQTVQHLNRQNVRPILISNQSEPIIGCNYSCVCSDINSSVSHLLGELKAIGKTRVALYGINTNSITDVGKVDSLFALKDDTFDSMQVFINDGSLENCFKDFFPARHEFDAIICSNDFAAVSLIRHLKETDAQALSEIKILSCSQSEISSCYRGLITSINMNYEQYGKAAVFIYERLKRYSYMSGMTIYVSWNMECMTSPEHRRAIPLPEFAVKDKLYEDAEMRDMLNVETILTESDGVDREIIRSLINNATIEETAKNCFLTDGGVKYRIKRILNKCKLSGKSELLSLLKNYLTDISLKNLAL